MTDRRRIIVVGAGVVGLCSAWYAARRGHDVTVIERNPPDHDGCSLGNAGMIVPSHFVPLAAPGMVRTGLRMLLNPEGPFRIQPRVDRDLVAWCWRFMRACTREHVERAAPFLRDLHMMSRRCYEGLQEEIGDFGLATSGLLMLCETERGFEEEQGLATMAERLELECEVLAPAGVAERLPGLGTRVAGAVYYPADGHLTPRRFMAQMREALERAGVRMLWLTAADCWRIQDGRIQAIRAGGDELEADEFVLAAGSWSPGLAREIGLQIPIQAGKGYSLTLPNPPALPAIPSILVEAKVAVTPMDSALRFAGTMEICGLDRSISDRRIHGIVCSVCRCFPGFSPNHFAGLEPWSGLRPCSPDGLPYIGRTERIANLILATGHAMMGMSLGPATGRLVSEIIAGEAPSLPLDIVRPDRFA